MENQSEILKIKKHWEERALSKEHTSTQPDGNLRELEIFYVSRFLSPDVHCIDIGCGTGYSTYKYASEVRSIIGIDYSENMIKVAREKYGKLKTNLDFEVSDILDLKFPPESFDIAISTRCLINLPSWNLQKQALIQIHKVIKPKGRFILLEGSQDGLAGLNELRKYFNLPEVELKWHNNLFNDKQLLDFLSKYYTVVDQKSFGTYYLVSRIVHPLYIYPNPPEFNHKLNKVAFEVSKLIDNLGEKWSLNKLYVLEKR